MTRGAAALAMCLGAFAQAPPGAPPRDDALAVRLAAALRLKGPSYQARTKHRDARGAPIYTNRLVLESSPYLLQHAHNPVDWHPWGDEAFALAKKLGRPVLLSVGYSTCHWCHVMEEESFEDVEIARYLNEHYIAVKVDREERPDVDSVYMTAVQALTGSHGGWPMTVWLTPGRLPFYGATYLPPRDGDRGFAAGFLSLLGKLRTIYHEQPERVVASAAEAARVLELSLAARRPSEIPPASILDDAARSASARFDPVNGGSRGGPKFPSGLPQRFLLRHYRRAGDAESLRIAATTLEKMSQGGIYDHVGGGFHRYATDARWRVPHFEKMLYDNALLAMDYLDAFQATGREDFARIAREILRYVERDMTSPEGAFYSATDADSLAPSGKREEGWFFTWTPAEIEAVLGKQLGRLVGEYYGVAEKGGLEGRSILHTPSPLAGMTRAALDEARDLLYAARLRRPPPLRDGKILTSWNGLMISAHARAALVLGDDRYAARAARAASFLLANLRRDGRLLRSYMNGAARHAGYLDDYAFLIAGLLDLFEASGDRRWLGEALALDAVLEKHFEDAGHGGYFFTSHDHERLLAREKPGYDGAEPSGNSVAAMNLLRLHEFTTEDRYRRRAGRTIGAFGEVLAKSPLSLAEMLLAVDWHYDTPKEIVIVTPVSRADAAPMLAKLRAAFLPNRILVVVPRREVEEMARLVPLVEGKTAREGKTTAYVCERRVCDLPTTDPEVFARQIAKPAR
jgi:uncharacterized protein YyaL (SSP411 family)